MKTAVYLKGALEPLLLDEPLDVTALNMSASLNNQLWFFRAKDVGGKPVVIAIREILFMRDEDDE